MYCPNCGKEIGNSNSCPKCGWKDRTPAKPKKKPGCLIGLLVFFGIAFFVFVSSMSYENPSTLEDAYLRIDQEQAKTEQEIIVSARRILDQIGLAKRADVLASSLSCGELRLLEVGVALSAKPRLLMLDEPAAGLNTHEAEGLADLLKQLPGQWVESILLVEHNMGLIMRVSDQIVVMNFGKKLATGTPAQIQANEQVLEAYMGKAA